MVLSLNSWLEIDKEEEEGGGRVREGGGGTGRAFHREVHIHHEAPAAEALPFQPIPFAFRLPFRIFY